MTLRGMRAGSPPVGAAVACAAARVRRPCSSRAPRGVAGVPVRRSTPRRCRSCRRGRSRWPGRRRPARFPRSRPRSVLRSGNSPCQVLAIQRPSGVSSSPQAYSAPSSPPRAAQLPLGLGRDLPCPPSSRRPRRRPRRRARPDGPACCGSSCRAPAGCRQSAPGTCGHQLCGSARLTRCRGATNTTENGHEHLRPGAGIVGRVGRPLGHGDVSGLAHEAAELAVGHRARIDPESVDGHRVGRRLLGIVMVGAHREGRAGDPHHPVRRRRRGRGAPGAWFLTVTACSCLPHPRPVLSGPVTRASLRPGRGNVDTQCG